MSATLVNLVLAAFLLAANGFFVASEFALVKSRGFRIDAHHPPRKNSAFR